MSRLELAKYLGVSIMWVRRKEVRGELEPSIREDGNGRVFYSLEYVKNLTGLKDEDNVELASRLRTIGTAQSSDSSVNQLIVVTGKESARAFAAFERGLKPAQVVIEQEITPQVAKDLYKRWIDLNSIILITAQQLYEISRLGLEGTYPIVDAEMLIANLREIAKTAKPCVRCKGKHKKPRHMCATCVDELIESETSALEDVYKNRKVGKAYLTGTSPGA